MKLSLGQNAPIKLSSPSDHHLFAFQIISWGFRYVYVPAFWSLTSAVCFESTSGYFKRLPWWARHMISISTDSGSVLDYTIIGLSVRISTAKEIFVKLPKINHLYVKKCSSKPSKIVKCSRLEEAFEMQLKEDQARSDCMHWWDVLLVRRLFFPSLTVKRTANQGSLLRNQATFLQLYVSRSSSFALKSHRTVQYYPKGPSMKMRAGTEPMQWTRTWTISPVSSPIRLWTWFSHHGFPSTWKILTENENFRTFFSRVFQKGLEACISWWWKDYLGFYSIDICPPYWILKTKAWSTWSLHSVFIHKSYLLKTTSKERQLNKGSLLKRNFQQHAKIHKIGCD